MFTRIAIKVLTIILALAIVIGLWYGTRTAGYTIAQGPTSFFDLGNNYRIEDGYVTSIISQETGHEMVIYEKVIKLSIDGPWISGKTEKGYFAINKTTDLVKYPILKEEDLEAIIGHSIPTLEWKDWILKYSSQYKIEWPHTKKIVSVIDAFFFIIAMTITIILSIGVKRTGKFLTSPFKSGEIQT